MNDFQMTHLANDRVNDLRAEADRQRLVRSARQASVPHHSSKPRGRRPRLDLVLRRFAIS